ADGQARVQIGGEQIEVMAHVATDSERETLWPLLVRLYPDFDRYQSWTVRRIPVLVLSPR
ncbi:nitroreductase/quinone reductase family protein, partial [Leptospira interrogans]|uniref:nitroreductase/quinone reductase family protein n=1 Tax=Leptospira interrogans TaxID=173 RepID=UPI00188C3E54